MANARDRQIASSGDRAAIRRRIIAIHSNRNAPMPPNLEAMVTNVLSRGANYFDTIRQHAVRGAQQQQQSTTQPTTPTGGGGITSPGGQPFQPSPFQPPNQAIATPPAQQPGGGGGTTEPQIDYVQRVRDLMPWLPESLIQLFADAWAETGSREIALQRVRQSPTYKGAFPGNVRDDGTIRLTEQQYFARRESYRQVFASFNLAPEAFEGRHTQLIEGGVTAQELNQRIATAQVEIAQNLRPIQEAYGRLFGVDADLSSILASAIDPDISPVIYQRRFRTAQIAGEAQAAGFQLGLEDANQIAAAGLNQEAARQFYRRAEGLLPTLNEFLDRHRDPSDEFTLDELEDALIFEDPEQQRMIRQLFAAERSLFSPATSLRRRRGEGPLAALR